MSRVSASGFEAPASGGVGFVTGWSYPPTVFEPLVAGLAGRPVSTWDWSAFVDTWLAGDPPAPALSPATWVGWSLGGALLLEALRLGCIAPKRLILLNATPRFLEAPGWPGVAAGEWQGLRRAAARQPRAAVAAFRRRFSLPDVVDSPGRAAAVGGLDWLARLDLRTFMADVSTPVECWLASRDPLVPSDWPLQLPLSPQVSCHRFAGVGHAPWWRGPDELVARLREC